MKKENKMTPKKNKKAEIMTLQTLIGLIVSIILLSSVMKIGYDLFGGKNYDETFNNINELLAQTRNAPEEITLANMITIPSNTLLLFFAPKEKNPEGIIGDGDIYYFQSSYISNKQGRGGGFVGVSDSSVKPISKILLIQRPSACADEKTCYCVCEKPTIITNTKDDSQRLLEIKKTKIKELKNNLETINKIPDSESNLDERTKNKIVNYLKLINRLNKEDNKNLKYSASNGQLSELVCETQTCASITTNKKPLLLTTINDQTQKTYLDDEEITYTNIEYYLINGFILNRDDSKPRMLIPKLPKKTLLYAQKTGERTAFCLNEGCFNNITEEIKKAKQLICELEPINETINKQFQEIINFYKTILKGIEENKNYYVEEFPEGYEPILNREEKKLQLIKKCGKKEIIKKEEELNKMRYGDEWSEPKKNLNRCDIDYLAETKTTIYTCH